MPYRVDISSAAGRDLKRLPNSTRDPIESTILALADGPRPTGSRKLVGWERRWRIRVGDYRVVYDVFDQEQTVVVTNVLRRFETTYRRRR